MRAVLGPSSIQETAEAHHGLNPSGNRQLNHAFHVAAIACVAHDNPGRAYYEGAQPSLGRADADRQRGDAQRFS